MGCHIKAERKLRRNIVTILREKWTKFEELCFHILLLHSALSFLWTYHTPMSKYILLYCTTVHVHVIFPSNFCVTFVLINHHDSHVYKTGIYILRIWKPGVICGLNLLLVLHLALLLWLNFFPPQTPTFSNSNSIEGPHEGHRFSIRNAIHVLTLLNKVDLLFVTIILIPKVLTDFEKILVRISSPYLPW